MITITCLFVTFIACDESSVTLCTGRKTNGNPGYTLVWSDEFNGSQLNTSVWRYDTDTRGNNQGWGNNESQWYTGSSGDNVYLESGNLVIEAQHESMGGKSYTSGRIHTHGGKSFQYGIIEARIRQPTKNNSVTDPGIWPAFWLLGDNFNGWGHNSYGGTTGWPQSGEIDVMELSGKYHRTQTSGSLHWYNSRHRSETARSSPSSSVYTNYYIYSICWDSNTIEWYIDETRFLSLDIRDSQYDAFRKPFFILLNFAIGGSLGGTPESANYPQKLYVDWVRHYQ